MRKFMEITVTLQVRVRSSSLLVSFVKLIRGESPDGGYWGRGIVAKVTDVGRG